MAITHPWQGHWQEAGFTGFIRYMAKDHIDRFYEETGEKFIPSSGGINAMIDDATGANEALLQRFIDWCVVQYGTPEQVGV